MRIELNIGLNVEKSDNTPEQRAARADFALRFLGRDCITQNILGSRRAQSATEDTLIVVLQVSSGAEARLRTVINDLAHVLLQDCIAVYYVTGWSGELIGPGAAAWGAFNPDFFIRCDPNDGPAKIFAKTPESKAQYTGHGANTGGLQGHSMGDEYPYLIIGVADRWEAPTEYSVMDTRTGNRSPRYPTYQRAYIELTSLKLRNCMHS